MRPYFLRPRAIQDIAHMSHKSSTALRYVGTGADFVGFASLQGVDPASLANLPETRTNTRPPFARYEFCEKCGLEEIADFTLEMWGSEQEDIYLELLEKAFIAISKNPNLGRVYDEVYSGLRRYLAGRHIILYQVTDDAVEIVRVLHHSMDFESHL